MALVEVELATHLTIDSIGAWGDVSLRTHPTVDNPWNELDSAGMLGSDASDEWVIFLRYDLSDISPALPSGATITRAFFNLTSASAATTQGVFGAFRVGHLERDGRWDISGSGWSSPQYPSGVSTNFPFPTDPNSDAIHAGILLDDKWLGSVFYLAHSAGTVIDFGDEDYLPSIILNAERANPVAHALERDRTSHGNTPRSAFVLDPYLVPTGLVEGFIVEMEDNDFTAGIRLILEYDQNPPTITNVPSTSGCATILYSEQMTATDPTGQDITFAFLDNPSGAIIVNGLIEWTPTEFQVGNNTFEVEATDEDGFTDSILWVVDVVSRAALDGNLDGTSVLAASLASTANLGGSLESQSILSSTRLEAEIPVLGATRMESIAVLDATRLEAKPRGA